MDEVVTVTSVAIFDVAGLKAVVRVKKVRFGLETGTAGVKAQRGFQSALYHRPRLNVEQPLML